MFWSLPSPFFKFFSVITEKYGKKISSFFHVSDDSEQLSKNFQKIFENFSKFFSGGGHQGAKFFFRFLAVSGHSESILIFSDFLQNRSDRGGGGGGGGPKILVCDKTLKCKGLVLSTLNIINAIQARLRRKISSSTNYVTLKKVIIIVFNSINNAHCDPIYKEIEILKFEDLVDLDIKTFTIKSCPTRSVATYSETQHTHEDWFLDLKTNVSPCRFVFRSESRNFPL